MEERNEFLRKNESAIKSKATMDETLKVYQTVEVVRKRYVNAFTMHALEHIVNGTWIEKVFWTLTLTTAVFIAGFLSRKLFVSFLNHETDTVVKIKAKTDLQLPKVHIWDNHTIKTFYSFADCSSNSSESYDARMCSRISKGAKICAELANASFKDREDAFDYVSKEPTVSCAPYLMLNENGDLYQNYSVEAMKYTLNINSSHLPLFMIISPPEDKVFTMKSTSDMIPINRHGDYRFKIEKSIVTRLPSPYSKPPCVMQGTSEAEEKNILEGDYSLGKCLMSCSVKALLEQCGAISQANRPLLRDKDFFNLHYKDQNISMKHQCVHGNLSASRKMYRICAEECPYSCQEVHYQIHEKYVPNVSAGSRVRLFVYFDELKENHTEHIPRLDVPTLLANFGGQLGLMAGVSAISIVELFIWILLVLANHIQFIYNCYKGRF